MPRQRSLFDGRGARQRRVAFLKARDPATTQKRRKEATSFFAATLADYKAALIAVIPGSQAAFEAGDGNDVWTWPVSGERNDDAAPRVLLWRATIESRGVRARFDAKAETITLVDSKAEPAVLVKPRDRDAIGGAALVSLVAGLYEAETGGDERARWLRFTRVA